MSKQQSRRGRGRRGSPPHLSRVPLARDFSRYSRNGAFARRLSLGDHLSKTPESVLSVQAIQLETLISDYQILSFGVIAHRRIDCNYSITLVCSNCFGFFKPLGHFFDGLFIRLFLHIFYPAYLAVLLDNGEGLTEKTSGEVARKITRRKAL